MYINHLTLSTGDLTRIERGDVAGEALARVAPWLAGLTQDGGPAPLPTSMLHSYTAHATVHDGALIVTVSGPPMVGGPMDGKAPPMVTIGVAKRSRHGAALWPLMTESVLPPPAHGLQRPAEPWCAVVVWPTAMIWPVAMAWLSDLERCIAWAWVTRAEG